MFDDSFAGNITSSNPSHRRKDFTAHSLMMLPPLNSDMAEGPVGTAVQDSSSSPPK